MQDMASPASAHESKRDRNGQRERERERARARAREREQARESGGERDPVDLMTAHVVKQFHAILQTAQAIRGRPDRRLNPQIVHGAGWLQALLQERETLFSLRGRSLRGRQTYSGRFTASLRFKHAHSPMRARANTRIRTRTRTRTCASQAHTRTRTRTRTHLAHAVEKGEDVDR